MSLAGLIAARGELVTVYHGVDTPSPDGGSGRTYPTNTPSVRMLLEDLTDARAVRVFGTEAIGTVRACMDLTTPSIADHDVIVVTEGLHLGEQLRVVKRLRHVGNSPHRELLLEKNSEVLT